MHFSAKPHLNRFKLDCYRLCDASFANSFNVPEIRSAASADDVYISEFLQNFAVLFSEFNRISDVKLDAFVKLGVALG